VKTGFKRPAVGILIIALGLVLDCRLGARTFMVLHNFTNADGNNPLPGLVLSSNTLYGVTLWGGGVGTVFKVNTDGTSFTNLHHFSGGNNGGNPNGRLVLSSNTLYGTTLNTLFSIRTDGTGFTNLHVFSGTDGAYVYAGLVLSGNTLYGTADRGGTGASGTVFSIRTDGTGFTNLYNFNGSDGRLPYAGLLLLSNTLYGVTEDGGSSDDGTVFAVNTDGSGFKVLYEFSATLVTPYHTNTDGSHPKGELILSGSTFYGTAANGGDWADGTVYAINTDGSGFRTLHNFSFTNEGGAFPVAGLVFSDDTLYGTAWSGDTGGRGGVFALKIDGTGFTSIHSFDAAYPAGVANPTNTDGAEPWSSLLLSGNTLYGTTTHGGLYGFGTVFSIAFSPQLSIAPSGMNLVLSWPTNYAGFDYTGYKLEATTNLGSSAIWSTNLPAPAIINGQYTVTNRISGTQQFFRLSQ